MSWILLTIKDESQNKKGVLPHGTRQAGKEILSQRKTKQKTPKEMVRKLSQPKPGL